MNKKEKLVKRFRTLPKDFTFEEVEALFWWLWFHVGEQRFHVRLTRKVLNKKDQNTYIMHKPHPNNIIKGYMLRDILNYLLNNGYIK